jgi:hypothetical protein
MKEDLDCLPSSLSPFHWPLILEGGKLLPLKKQSNLKLQQFVKFGALEEVFMSYRPHGAWRTMEVLEELA